MAKTLEPLVGRMVVFGKITEEARQDPLNRYEEDRYPAEEPKKTDAIKKLAEESFTLRLRADLPATELAKFKRPTKKDPGTPYVLAFGEKLARKAGVSVTVPMQSFSFYPGTPMSLTARVAIWALEHTKHGAWLEEVDPDEAFADEEPAVEVKAQATK